MPIKHPNPFMRFVLSLSNNGKWLVLSFLINTILIAVVFSLVEKRDLFTSFYWTFVTTFTVGYGDVSPSTVLGRGFSFYVMATQWLLMLFISAFIILRLVLDQDQFSHEEQEQIKASLARIEAKLGTNELEGPRSTTRQVDLGFPYDTASHPPRDRHRSIR